MKTIAIVKRGSTVYGTNVEGSDVDRTGLFKHSVREYLKPNFKDYFEIDKDFNFTELGKFISLCGKSPVQTEILFTPKQYYEQTSPEMEFLLENRNMFLTKQLAQPYLGFVKEQLNKGQNTVFRLKMEKEEVHRKDPLDFCFVLETNKTIPLKVFLETKNLSQENLSLSKLNHTREGYLLYNYKNKGLCGEESTALRLSEIPKGLEPITSIYYNEDAYSSHCKQYREYQDWLVKRNPHRYTQLKENADYKFLYHAVRLLNTSEELFSFGEIIVDRRNRDAQLLIDIRTGQKSLEEIVEYCETKIITVKEKITSSTLPEKIDWENVKELIADLRSDEKG